MNRNLSFCVCVCSITFSQCWRWSLLKFAWMHTHSLNRFCSSPVLLWSPAPFNPNNSQRNCKTFFELLIHFWKNITPRLEIQVLITNINHLSNRFTLFANVYCLLEPFGIVSTLLLLLFGQKQSIYFIGSWLLEHAIFPFSWTDDGDGSRYFPCDLLTKKLNNSHVQSALKMEIFLLEQPISCK